MSPAFARSSVSVAEVHRDTDGGWAFTATADGAYTRRGTAVAGTSFVTTGDESSRAATETTAADTGTPSAAEPTEPAAGTTGTPELTGTTTPGFTALLALVAPVGGAAPAGRPFAALRAGRSSGYPHQSDPDSIPVPVRSDMYSV